MKTTLFLAAALALGAQAKVYFKETFNSEDWADGWTYSTAKPEGERGEFKHTAGKNYGKDLKADAMGIQTGKDARFYAISAPLTEEFKSEGKDLVIQYSVKHEQNIDCGGAYIKLLPPGLEQGSFGGDSAYAVMFGPDICGTSTRKIHQIFTYKGENLLTKKETRAETDELSHLYTFVVKPDNTYQVYVDGKEREAGSLGEDWDFLKPKEIPDPEVSKPADWVDTKKIPDPEDKKPEGYDDIPEQVPDEDAEKPDDWDDEDDGEWEPPMVPNPEYRGPWQPKLVDNPEYKGEWVHPLVANPEFEDDDELYNVCNPSCAFVGFELWQVKAGTIFDDIIVTDSLEEAQAFAKDTFDVKAPAEKDAKKEKDDKEAKRREEDEAKKEAAEAERKAKEADEDEDDYDDEEEDEKDEL